MSVESFHCPFLLLYRVLEFSLSFFTPFPAKIPIDCAVTGIRFIAVLVAVAVGELGLGYYNGLGGPDGGNGLDVLLHGFSWEIQRTKTTR